MKSWLQSGYLWAVHPKWFTLSETWWIIWLVFLPNTICFVKWQLLCVWDRHGKVLTLSYRGNKDTCKPLWPAPNPGLPHSGSQHNLDRLQVLVKLWLSPEDALQMAELPEVFTVLCCTILHKASWKGGLCRGSDDYTHLRLWLDLGCPHHFVSSLNNLWYCIVCRWQGFGSGWAARLASVRGDSCWTQLVSSTTGHSLGY